MVIMPYTNINNNRFRHRAAKSGMSLAGYIKFAREPFLIVSGFKFVTAQFFLPEGMLQILESRFYLNIVLI